MHMVDDQAAQPDQGDGEPLAPMVYMLHFKKRRALICRGEDREADAVARGFKKVTHAHFVNYLDNVKKGFRRKPKAKGAKKQ